MSQGITNVNPHLKNLEVDDFLFHLGLNSSMDLKAMFGDVRYVIMQGSPERARDLAFFLAKEFDVPFDGKAIGKTERFSLYKVKNVICVSHGMGMPSLSILLHEMYKLLYYAGSLEKCTLIRSGTCCGFGVAPGTVAITTESCDTELRHFYSQAYLDKRRDFPAIAEKSLVRHLQEVAEENGIPAVTGYTISADGFYEDEARTDGFFCEFGEEEKFAYFKKIQEAGVCNMEMESLVFLAFALRAHVRAGVACSVLIDRLQGDQIKSSGNEESLVLANWKLLCGLVKKYPEGWEGCEWCRVCCKKQRTLPPHAPRSSPGS